MIKMFLLSGKGPSVLSGGYSWQSPDTTENESDKGVAHTG